SCSCSSLVILANTSDWLAKAFLICSCASIVIVGLIVPPSSSLPLLIPSCPLLAMWYCYLSCSLDINLYILTIRVAVSPHSLNVGFLFLPLITSSIVISLNFCIVSITTTSISLPFSRNFSNICGKDLITYEKCL